MPNESSENTYWQRTETYEEKLRLLEAAWRRNDVRLARALAPARRRPAPQAQTGEGKPGAPAHPGRLGAAFPRARVVGLSGS